MEEIPTVFDKGSNYKYHFIMEEAAEEFEGQFTCLGQNTAKYITISVPIELMKMDMKSQKPYLTDYKM